MKDLKLYVQNKITRTEFLIDRIKDEQGANPPQTHNYHGGHALGYWEGRLSMLEDIIEIIEENEKSDE